MYYHIFFIEEVNILQENISRLALRYSVTITTESLHHLCYDHRAKLLCLKITFTYPSMLLEGTALCSQNFHCKMLFQWVVCESVTNNYAVE